MGMLTNFKDLKLSWDHSFFFLFFAPKIPISKDKVKGIDEYGTDLH
jgi:hypothetical protein